MLSIREYINKIKKFFAEMPFPSIVPHIVGDDDSETTDGNPSSKSPKSPSSSVSSYEETEDEEDMDSLDEADWSMNVSHIARTPERQPSPICGDSMEDCSTISSVKEEDPPEVPAIGLNEPGPRTEVLINPNESPQNIPTESQAELQFSASSSPQSVLPPKLRFLRKMNESQPYPTVANPLRNCASHADYSFPETIGGRVARRGRRSICQAISIRPTEEDSSVAVAKPLDVTAYFHQVSAELVQNRVSLVHFLALQERLDRLMAQTLVDSKMLRKQRPPRSV
ncbi:uncharacterized protein Dana_GF19708, isoform C [Drosophila ananassae]|uniref:Uncharacterized protein, isoform C n=1 Tax=Drosophila ananassae TaxID=7217 RepID=A0A0P8XFJ6_DROAN|nr:uncharacterized protein LOC6502456 isoform X2 [Drosophila ananassae]KPU73358.1 uncharacterized protein Dana_GF19708, isoform C [Drosophila ananassae]